MQRVRSRIGDELKRKEKNRKGGGGGVERWHHDRGREGGECVIRIQESYLRKIGVLVKSQPYKVNKSPRVIYPFAQVVP